MAGIRSSSTEHGYLNVLGHEGYITKKESIPRSIRVTEKGLNIIEG